MNTQIINTKTERMYMVVDAAGTFVDYWYSKQAAKAQAKQIGGSFSKEKVVVAA